MAWYDDLLGADRDAAAGLIELFRRYGLEGLAPKIVEMVQDGMGTDAVFLRLQETKEWKQRFKGNELRRQRGLPVLTPQEYLATERSYRQLLAQYNMPRGFYDSPADFADWIGRDLSPSEIQERVQVASDWANSQNPETRDALRRLYGLGAGELTAAALNPDKALPLLRRQAQAVGIAAAALRQGLDPTRDYSERLAELGVTAEQASSGYADIAQALPTFVELGQIYGSEFNQRTAEQAVFEGEEGAVRTRRRLASQERAAFSGSSRGQTGRVSSGY